MHTISSIFTRKEVIANKSAIRAIFIVSFVAMTALGAYVRIPLPFSPVPITLQTFFVILCGAVLGRKLGVFAQVSYLALGGLGMPIFQGYGSGLFHFAGPTGGYLVGFVAASFVTGALIDRTRESLGISRVIFAMSAGLFTIYVFGITWLVIGYNFSLAKAISLGFVPFIPGAAAKLAIASWIYSKIHSRTNPLI
jgi:biotin transport system substrate-specific component